MTWAVFLRAERRATGWLDVTPARLWSAFAEAPLSLSPPAAAAASRRSPASRFAAKVKLQTLSKLLAAAACRLID
jgi:hypothetical protein